MTRYDVTFKNPLTGETFNDIVEADSVEEAIEMFTEGYYDDTEYDVIEAYPFYG
jgi:hypothetical protein